MVAISGVKETPQRIPKSERDIGIHFVMLDFSLLMLPDCIDVFYRSINGEKLEFCL